jgi:hypothetical protein
MIELIGIILMTPLLIIVVVMNMSKTEACRLRKMKEQADAKRGRR